MSKKRKRSRIAPDSADNMAILTGASLDSVGGEAQTPEDGEPYYPRHLADDGSGQRRGEGVGDPAGGEYIRQPDGTNIAPNGAVIRNPWSETPEIKPDNEYTDEKEDMNLLIM